VAKTPLGISLVTILPAPITVLSPIVTPGKIITFVVIQTLLPITIGFAKTVEKSSKSCEEVYILQF
jgi:pheromone shutdown protein TraB